MASLIDYILKLTHSWTEREKFQTSVTSARESMTSYGLDEKQQEILLNPDWHQLGEAIQKEFDGELGRAAYHNTQCMVNIPIPNPPPK
jgi:hypothetical protein